MDYKSNLHDMLSNNDLIQKKYPIEVIEKNIGYLRLTTILATQNVTPEFCKKYVFDKDNKYAKDEKDKNIYMNDVLYLQRHILKKDFFETNTHSDTSIIMQ